MTEKETTVVFAKLSAGFPGLEVKTDTIALWSEYLRPLNFQSIMHSINDYLLSAGTKYRFPLPGEILEFYDKHETKRVIKQRNQELDDDKEAAKFLFHSPVNTMKNDYVKQSVQMIRDVCNNKVKYQSPEWKQRFVDIYGKDGA